MKTIKMERRFNKAKALQQQPLRNQRKCQQKNQQLKKPLNQLKNNPEHQPERNEQHKIV